MAMVSASAQAAGSQSQAERDTYESKCHSVASGNMFVGTHGREAHEFDPVQPGSSLTAEPLAGDHEGSGLGVHGVPFSSVRSTKTTAHLAGHHNKHRESHAVADMPSFKNSSGINGVSVATHITKR